MNRDNDTACAAGHRAQLPANGHRCADRSRHLTMPVESRGRGFVRASQRLELLHPWDPSTGILDLPLCGRCRDHDRKHSGDRSCGPPLPNGPARIGIEPPKLKMGEAQRASSMSTFGDRSPPLSPRFLPPQWRFPPSAAGIQQNEVCPSPHRTRWRNDRGA
jgi:hypothetical protein